jgi:DNA-binding transcriptional LysR family regulator
MFEKIFSKRGLSVERLLALVETKEAGSIAKAAPNDIVRQGQYSRQIKELEEFFGFELGARRGRRLELTAAGQELARIGKEFLLGLQDYQSRQRGETTTVTIGAYESVTQWLLLPRLAKLQRQFPRVQWILDGGRTSDIVRGLSELTLDLGLVRQNAVTKPLRHSGVLRLTYCVFAPKAKVPKNRQQDANWILENLPVVLPHGRGEFKTELERGAEREGVKIRLVLACETAVQASAAIATGEFCGIVPAIAAAELGSEKFLHLETSLLHDYRRNICLAWNPRLFELRPQLEPSMNRLAELLAA